MSFVKRGMIFWFPIQIVTLVSCAGVVLCWSCKFQGKSDQLKLINIIRQHDTGCVCVHTCLEGTWRESMSLRFSETTLLPLHGIGTLQQGEICLNSELLTFRMSHLTPQT